MSDDERPSVWQSLLSTKYDAVFAECKNWFYNELLVYDVKWLFLFVDTKCSENRINYLN